MNLKTTHTSVYYNEPILSVFHPDFPQEDEETKSEEINRNDEKIKKTKKTKNDQDTTTVKKRIYNRREEKKY